MEQRAGKYGVLPCSSGHRVVTKQAMPHGLSQLRAYLRACEVPEVDWSEGEAAWIRVLRQEKQGGFFAHGRLTTFDVDLEAVLSVMEESKLRFEYTLDVTRLHEETVVVRGVTYRPVPVQPNRTGQGRGIGRSRLSRRHSARCRIWERWHTEMAMSGLFVKSA